MFKFDFRIEEKDESEGETDKNNDVAETKVDNSTQSLNCHSTEEILITKEHVERMPRYLEECMISCYGDVKIQRVNFSSFELLEAIDDDNDLTDDVLIAEKNHSDLIPGVYEGGAKIWECTADLIEYLVKNFDKDFFNGKSILDLGCGHGLLGLYALKCGAFVHFHDYNRDVLQKITIPNVIINTTDFVDVSSVRAKFISGDWGNYIDWDGNNEKFDMILTSETIYNPQNYGKIIQIVRKKLKENGIGLLAAKTHYFGVGGDLRQFEKMLSIDDHFSCTTVWRFKKGVEREILQIKWKN